MKYLNWLAKMLEIEKLGEMPKDASDYSFYITRIINSCIADLCLAKGRGRDKNFRLEALMTKEERLELCELLTLIFEKCAKHSQVSLNLREFSDRNHFDYYYRFLPYLLEIEAYPAFNRMGLSIVVLLSTSTYTLPPLYRT